MFVEAPRFIGQRVGDQSGDAGNFGGGEGTEQGVLEHAAGDAALTRLAGTQAKKSPACLGAGLNSRQGIERGRDLMQ